MVHRPGTLYSGEVREFDAARGLGQIVVSQEGSDDHRGMPAKIMFHCIEIADGSRQIEVGAPVVFRLMRRFGGFEAAAVTTPQSIDR